MKHVTIFIIFISLLLTLNAITDNLMKFSTGAPTTEITVNNQRIVFASSMGIVFKQNYLSNDYILYDIPGIDSRSITAVWTSNQERVFFTYYDYQLSDYKLVKFFNNQLIEFDFPSDYSFIRKSFQDSSDRLWFLCQDIVCVFDLNNFQWQTYTDDNTGVNISDITDICEDYNQSIWFSTRKSNIIKYHDNQWQSNSINVESQDFIGFYHIAVSSNDEIVLSDFHSLYLLQNYEIVETIEETNISDIKVIGNYFYYVNRLSEVFLYMPSSNYHFILGNQLSDGIAVTNSHLIMYHKEHQDDVKYISYDFCSPVSTLKTGNFKYNLPNNSYDENIHLKFQPESQRLWYKTIEGLASMNSQYQWEYFDIETTGIDFTKLTDISIISEQQLIGFLNLGNNSRFIRFNGTQWLMDPPLNDSSSNIHRIIYDQNNVLWALSNDKLVYLKEDNTFYYVNPNLQIHQVISQLHKVGTDELWFSMSNGKLYAENINTKTYRLIFDLTTSQDLNILKINNPNDYWLFTPTHFIHVLNGQSQSYSLPDPTHHIVDCEFDNNGKLWIKTSYNLYSWENNEFTNHWYGNVKDHKFYSESLAIGHNNNICFFNDNVFYVYNQNSLSVTEEIIQTQDQLKISIYPNPFNPTTNIAFNLHENSSVSIKIYNIKGQLVKNYGTQTFSKGAHTIIWDGKDESNHSQSSGIYFVKIQTSDYTATQKMMMIK